jgi:hypothetical protein
MSVIPRGYWTIRYRPLIRRLGYIQNPERQMFRYVIVGLIWSGVIFSAVVGYIYTPNFRMKRGPDNRKQFWSAWAASSVLALIASYLAWQLRF